MSRSDNASMSPNGKIMANASISYISYQDIDLLETTILDEAHEYVKNLLGNDLISFKKGDLSTKTKANTLHTRSNTTNKRKRQQRQQHKRQ